MTATRIRRRYWFVAGLVIAAVAATLGAAGAMVEGFPLRLLDGADDHTVYATYSFDVSDPAQLVGWADDVFLGRVIEKSGHGLLPDSNPDRSSDMPYSLYRVEVLQSLKGTLSGVVEIRQDGGVAADGATVLWEGDPMLERGETCLFVTHGEYDSTAGWDKAQGPLGRPRLVNGYGDIRVRSEAEMTTLLNEYRAAIAEQVDPEL